MTTYRKDDSRIRPDLKEIVENHAGFVFDLDGTIYLGDELIDGADEVIRLLRETGKKVAFLSNKPIARREEYAAKLNRLGIPCSDSDVINSTLVLARYVSKSWPGAKVFPIAERPVIDELERHGLEICDEPEAVDVVVVSWDRNFDYEKLNTAYRAVVNGARLIGTNPDRTCPMPGYDLPDAACMIAAVEACTERKVEPVVGKPSRIMLQEVLDLLKLEAADCVMFGDRVETDIVMANRAGLCAVLVLSGVTTDGNIKFGEGKPDYVLESVADLLSALSVSKPLNQRKK